MYLDNMFLHWPFHCISHVQPQPFSGQLGLLFNFTDIASAIVQLRILIKTIKNGSLVVLVSMQYYYAADPGLNPNLGKGWKH